MAIVLLCVLLFLPAAVIAVTEDPKCCYESECRNVVANSNSTGSISNTNFSALDKNEYPCQTLPPIANDTLSLSNITTASETSSLAGIFVCNDGYEGHTDRNKNFCCPLPADNLFTSFLIILLALGCFAFGFILVLVVGILRSKDVRSRRFNVYLIFLNIPSLIYIGLAIANSILKLRNQFASCVNHQGFYLIPFPLILFNTFYFPANFLLNAVIAHDIYDLLRCSKQCLRKKSLTFTAIYTRIAVVYLVAALYGTWNAFVDTDRIHSLPANSTTRWIVSPIIDSIILVPPILYIFYIFIQVWKDKLLPLRGQTRALALFFLRIVIVCFLFSVPLFIIWEIFHSSKYSDDIIVYFSSYYLAIAGEIISSLMVLTKPDVRLAAKELLCCGSGCELRNPQRNHLASDEPSEQIAGESSEQISGESSEQIRSIESTAEGGSGSENKMRIRAWDAPDAYGDNIARENYSDELSSRRSTEITITSSNNDERS